MTQRKQRRQGQPFAWTTTGRATHRQNKWPACHSSRICDEVREGNARRLQEEEEGGSVCSCAYVGIGEWPVACCEC